METVYLDDIGVKEYAQALELQRTAFEALLKDKERRKGANAGEVGGDAINSGGYAPAKQVLILCEHPHVYTLGRSGRENNLLVNKTFLEGIGATYFHADRGGDITYHGYGQIVAYPILDLERLGLGLKEYIHAMEEAVIDCVARYGISAGRLEGATGVWIDAGTARARKICAIGVRASRHVTMHGLALNVNTKLEYFSFINPCGFEDKGVTSIEKEIGREADMEDVKRVLAGCLAERLKFKIR